MSVRYTIVDGILELDTSLLTMTTCWLMARDKRPALKIRILWSMTLQMTRPDNMSVTVMAARPSH